MMNSVHLFDVISLNVDGWLKSILTPRETITSRVITDCPDANLIRTINFNGYIKGGKNIYRRIMKAQPVSPNIYTVIRQCYSYHEAPTNLVLDFYYDDGNMRKAWERSRELLVSELNMKQKLQFQDTGTFEVNPNLNPDYGFWLVFSITQAESYNVYYMENGYRSDTSYCLEIGNGNLPVFDKMLAQKIMIENDLERFLEVANS
jgi:hypothetical protein